MSFFGCCLISRGLKNIPLGYFPSTSAAVGFICLHELLRTCRMRSAACAQRNRSASRSLNPLQYDSFYPSRVITFHYFLANFHLHNHSSCQCTMCGNTIRYGAYSWSFVDNRHTTSKSISSLQRKCINAMSKSQLRFDCLIPMQSFAWDLHS